MTRKSRLFGATLLVAGCCIGAGMLGMPTISALAGFFPTSIFFVLLWLFMALTGIALAEVALSFKEDVNLMTMAHHFLGPIGRIVTGGLFLFLFYSLLVAYLSGSGQLIEDFTQKAFGITIPSFLENAILLIPISILLFIGTKAIDECNRIFILGLIVTFIALIVLGLPHIQIENLMRSSWKDTLFIAAPMAISFGFHNLVPSLTRYLKKNAKDIRFCILVGSAIPLALYIVWECVILGILSIQDKEAFKAILQSGDMPTRILRASSSATWTTNLMEYFSFFAIATSLIAIALSFVDFLSDGLHIKKTAKGKPVLIALCLVPPFLISGFYPKLFLTALSYAGAFGAMTLFGIIPCLMLYKGRYKEKWRAPKLLPGGKMMIGILFFSAILIIVLEIYSWRLK